jgi:hypothetical protein
MYSVHDPTGAFGMVAPDADWNVEPENIVPEVAAVPPSGSTPGSALVPASVRARPNPVLSTRGDTDSARIASNKDLLDAKHTSWVKAGVDLKALIITAIGTEHCATVASTHANGALRNCPALFIMEWLETEYGTIESQHVTERLATLDVVLTSSDQWPAHAAFFTTTIRRLRMAERRLPITIVPSDQALFIRLKASFANLREFDTSMGTFVSTNCTMQSQTCERLVAFLKTQKGFIRSQATSAQFAGGAQPPPAPAPAPAQQQQQRQSRRQRKGRKGRSPSPSPSMEQAFAALMSQHVQLPVPHPHLPPPQLFGQPYVHPHYGFASQQPPTAPLPPGLGAPMTSTATHTGALSRVYPRPRRCWLQRHAE